MEKNEIFTALAKAQLEISAPVKDKVNPRFKTAYSSLDAIYSACRIPLAKNGIVMSHTVEYVDSKAFLKTTLSHVSGAQVSNCIPMFVDAQTSQGFASALTYARRYAVCSLLSLPTDEDDDGEAATKEQEDGLTMTLPHQEEILKIIGKDNDLLERVLKSYGVPSVAKILDKYYDSIVSKLQISKSQSR